MSEHSPSDELIARIFAFMIRAGKDPGIVDRQPGELNAIVTAWRLLSVAVPGLLPYGAEEFQRYILSKGTKAVAEAFLARARGQLRSGDGSANQIVQNQRDLIKYNRMYEMMSKIVQNQHEMKKSLIANIR